MSRWLAYLVGVLTVPAGSGVLVLWVLATERTAYRCRVCGWGTGWTGALPAWFRWRWHRHVTRALGRCTR